ncbi:Zinc finger CCCH domain-containing protein 20 [Hibiscus syriacus]|uniref:Zinc finger CCCH domain-containing protein 20 n=1 Tax=Hibiscus syriacus TaxID=106335 RepID=A0A6A2ZKE4_HIBSY|nr:zinc finger CCCH domain-containing protein 23-like [Hibiscus syriacus]KAE8691405.1 Zinc finger CCCH domain-containing protein 20 [Hibiscus syriacus]
MVNPNNYGLKMQFIMKRTAPPLGIIERCPKMMIGEATRPTPTVKIPSWDPFNDITSSISSVNYNCNAPSSPCPVDYLSALQRYLPSNNFDSDSLSEESDIPIDAFSCDHFRMYEFKVRRCARGRSHDWTECPYAHPGEKARRRDPRKFHYSGTACPDFRKGICKKGDSCEFAHGVFECWLHPARYRTQPCKDGTSCKRRVCFFAHTPEQLRLLPQQSPRGNGSGSGEIDYVCSPVRYRLDLVSSPTSILASPPLSPPSDSPPMSPSGSFFSASELAASMRSMQLGKAKMSGACSWGLGYGLPRGSTLRPGFCRSPSAPTRSGLGQFDLWECNYSEEEPAMERVESGRDLRARMYAKLSKENSLDGPESIGLDPDLDWVSELVK